MKKAIWIVAIVVVFVGGIISGRMWESPNDSSDSGRGANEELRENLSQLVAREKAGMEMNHYASQAWTILMWHETLIEIELENGDKLERVINGMESNLGTLKWAMSQLVENNPEHRFASEAKRAIGDIDERLGKSDSGIESETQFLKDMKSGTIEFLEDIARTNARARERMQSDEFLKRYGLEKGDLNFGDAEAQETDPSNKDN